MTVLVPVVGVSVNSELVSVLVSNVGNSVVSLVTSVDLSVLCSDVLVSCTLVLSQSLLAVVM